MKALLTVDRHDMVYGEKAVPSPKAGEVRVKIAAASICGGDMSGYKSGVPPYEHDDAPRIPGHEFSGVVDEIGPEVKGVTLGQRVCIFPTLYCGKCHECRTGRINLCHSRGCVGGYKPEYGVKDGGLAEYATVPATHLVSLPDNVSFEIGSIVEPLAVGLHAVKQAGDLQGKDILIYGAGPIGLMTMEFAKLKGAKRIIVVDILNQRLETARNHGADLVLNTRDEACVEKAREYTGGIGPEIVFDAVGREESLDGAMEMCRDGGKIVLIGLAQPRMTWNYRRVIDREQTLIGSICYTDEMKEVVAMLAEGRLDAQYFITRKASLSEGPEIFDLLERDPAGQLKVVLIP